MKVVTVSDEMLKRNYVVELLRQGSLQIEFKKTDGSTRVMKCSLKDDLIKPYEKKTDKTRDINLENQSVFDLDKQEWRSFKWDNLISFNRI
jgi:hypothetical protein